MRTSKQVKRAKPSFVKKLRSLRKRADKLLGKSRSKAEHKRLVKIQDQMKKMVHGTPEDTTVTLH